MFSNLDIVLGEIVKQKAEITYNNNRTYPNGKKAPDGIEIRFGSARPTAEVRDMLKDHGFKFSEKQTMWYAWDNTKSRKFAEYLSQTEVDVDTAQYEKRNFWVPVKGEDEFVNLREHTEFYVKTEVPQYFYSKSFLRKSFPSIQPLIRGQELFYKRYYNKVVGEGNPETPNQSPAKTNKKGDTETAEKLQALAEGMQKQIDAKLNSAISKQRPTKRRMRIAAAMREEGHLLQEIQTVLYALAEAHRTGDIGQYPHLQEIRTRKHAELIHKYEITKGTFNHYEEDLLKLGINSEDEWSQAHEQKTKLVDAFSPSGIKQQNETENKIKELEMQVLEAKIPGFFPTPPDLIERLVELADLQPNDRILEPSAGKGDILDLITKKYPNQEVHAVERNDTLRKILELKGYQIVAADFPVWVTDERYDKVIMNPPFEDGQDVDHVRHAFSLLKPGGRVVAIMGEGVFFRQFKKDKGFREFLQEKNAFVSPPIKEAFKNAFNSTGVTVRIVAINANGILTNSGRVTRETGDETSDMAILELEAEAELELLKMRLEIERRKKRALQGLDEDSIDENKLQRFRRKAWAVQERWDVLNYK